MRRIITRERDVAGAIVYQHEETTRFTARPRYGGPWEAMMMFSNEGLAELHERMADKAIGMQAVRVLFAMLKSVDLHDNNRVRAGRKDLARMLEMSESNVSGAIRQLLACGFIEKPQYKFGYYTISPRLAWYGKVEDLRCALSTRGMLDEHGMMTAAAA